MSYVQELFWTTFSLPITSSFLQQSDLHSISVITSYLDFNKTSSLT